MEYPVHLLYIGILVHAAPRPLEVGGFVSDIIAPECSILAGCMQSMGWVKTYLYELLDTMHVHFRPVAVKGYVDDSAQSQQGSPRIYCSTWSPLICLLPMNYYN
eukprot:6011624-Pyramimonas_sp.AAC.1